MSPGEARFALALALTAAAWLVSEAVPRLLIPVWACFVFGFGLVYLGWIIIFVVIGDD